MKLAVLALLIAVGSAAIPTSDVVATKFVDAFKDLAANVLVIDRENIDQIAEIIQSKKPNNEVIGNSWRTITEELAKSNNAIIAEIKQKLPDDYAKMEKFVKANMSR